MRIYLAGPMRGVPQYNFPAFDAATWHLRGLGHYVISPAEIDRAFGFDPSSDKVTPAFLRDAMLRDIRFMGQCDTIALLPGWRGPEPEGDADANDCCDMLRMVLQWRGSRGALAELAVARFFDLRVAEYLPERVDDPLLFHDGVEP